MIKKGKSVSEFWDFPKGQLDKRESGLEAARREVKEEVGITNFELLPEFKETVHYFTWREGKRTLKFVAMFLAEAKTARVKLSWEHDKYEWLSYEEGLRRLTLPQMKRALEAAENFFNKLNLSAGK